MKDVLHAYICDPVSVQVLTRVGNVTENNVEVRRICVWVARWGRSCGNRKSGIVILQG